MDSNWTVAYRSLVCWYKNHPLFSLRTTLEEDSVGETLILVYYNR